MSHVYATYPYVLIFWLVFLWVFFPEFRIASRAPAVSSDEAKQDAGSKNVIFLGQSLSAVAAFLIAGNVTATALPHPRALFWLGLATMIAGSVLRRHCWRMLGKSFTGDVIVKHDQVVVDEGMYRFVRHPSYTGGALIFVGIGLALANWLSVLVVFVSTGAVYAYRVRVEERALVATIGEPYRVYMARTKRFVPFLF